MRELCKICEKPKTSIETVDGITRVNYCGCRRCRVCGFARCRCGTDIENSVCEDIFTRDLEGDIIPGPIYRGCGVKFTVYRDGIRSRIHSPGCEVFQYILGVR